MKFLANPLVLHGAVVLFCASFAFLLGMIFMRLLRKSIQEEADVSSDSPALEALPLHVYNTVIRQLKQQQDELKAQSQAEQQRSRTTERFTETVLANLSCGVLSVGKNGLVRSANPSAKQILGFASPIGMSVKDIFRAAVICSYENSDDVTDDATLVSDAFDSVLRSPGARREIQAEYETPSGERRPLAITIVQVLASDVMVSGTACLINDMTELRRLQQQAGGNSDHKVQAARAGV